MHGPPPTHRGPPPKNDSSSFAKGQQKQPPQPSSGLAPPVYGRTSSSQEGAGVSTPSSSVFSTPQHPTQGAASTQGEPSAAGAPAVSLFHNPSTLSNPSHQQAGPSAPDVSDGNSASSSATPTSHATPSTGSGVRAHSPRIYVRPRPLPRPPKRGTGSSTPTRPSSSIPGSDPARVSPAPRSGGHGHRYRLPPVRPKHARITPTPSSPASAITPQASPRQKPLQVTQSPPVGGLSAPVAKKTDALPPGWQQLTDASGRLYFFHAATNQTTWDRPAADKEEASPSLSAESRTEEEKDATKTQTVEKAPGSPTQQQSERIDVASDVNPLPAGWTEVKDPASGRVYYYNASSNETTWERPAPSSLETTEATAMLSGTTTNSTAAEQTEASSDLSLPHLELKSQSALAKVVDDPVEGPEEKMQQQEEQQQQQVDADDLVPKSQLVQVEATKGPSGDLPANWAEVMDPTGRPYYYNSATTETTWEKPTAAVSKVAEETMQEEPTAEVVEQPLEEKSPTDEVSEQQQEEASVKDEVPVQSEGDQAPAELPANWTEVMDPTGRPYYYNSVTNETSWERPTAEFVEVAEATEEEPTAEVVEQPLEEKSPTDEVSEQQQEEASVKDEVPVQSEGHQAPAELPANWTEVMDPTGRPYYYNSVTNETSWERPTAEFVEVAEATEEEPTAEVVEQPLEEKSPTDEVSEQQQEEASVKDEVPVQSEGHQAPAELPANWTEVMDPTGRPYYYNTATNETTWERPTAEFVEVAEATEEEPTAEVVEQPLEEESLKDDAQQPQEEASVKDEEPVQTEGHQAHAELPANWTEVMDPTGRPYYYNSVTNETTWERPTAEVAEVTEETPEEKVMPAATEQPGEGESLKDDAQQPQEEASVKDEEPVQTEGHQAHAELPANWTEVMDPTAGTPYYYNSVTNETTWERPTAEVVEVAEETPEEGVMPAATEQPGEGESLKDDAQQPQEEASVKDEEPVQMEEEQAPAELPANWTEVMDPTAGTPYYYNSVTNETTWERPTAEVAEVAEETPEEGVMPASTEQPGEGESLKDDAQQPQEEASVKDEEPVQMEEEQAPAELPANWTEVMDPTAGTPYYYNSVTNETTWERPTAEVVEVAEETPEEGVMPAATEQPREEESLKDDAQQPQEEASVKDEEPVQTEGHQAHAELPANWTEVMDPTAGTPYYYNSVTNETSWERPTAEVVEVAPETQEEPLAEVVNHERPEQLTSELPQEGKSPELKGEQTTWVALTDEEGRTYYYNEETNATQWDEPAEGFLGTSTLAAESMPAANQETNDSANTEEAADGHPTGSGPDQGITKEAAAETAAGLPDDQRTVEEDAPDTGAAAVEEDQGTGNVGAWIACKDEEGREYFYNQETNETAWEIPKAENPLTESQQMADKDSLKTIEQKGQPQEHVVSDQAEAPERTSESPAAAMADIGSLIEMEGVGGVSAAGECSTREDELDLSEATHQVNEQNESPETHLEVQVDQRPRGAKEELEEPENHDELPPGWVEAMDTSQGRKYYYNESTGESSWVPPSLDSVKGLGKMSPEDQVEESRVEEHSLDRTEVSCDRVDKEQEQSQKSTQEEPMLKPEGTAGAFASASELDDKEWTYDGQSTTEMDDEAEQERSLDEDLTEELEAVKQQSLPKGWVEATVPESGQIYYYNQETNESSWTIPMKSGVEGSSAQDEANSSTKDKAAFLSQDDKCTQEEPELLIESDQTSKEPTQGSPEEEEPDASKSADNTEINTTSGVSTKSDEVQTPPHFGLPSGWVRLIEEASGQPYFYNEATGETQWSRPESGDKTSELGSELASEPPQEEKSPELKGEQTTWVALTDEEGHTYYYNEETNATQWDEPTEGFLGTSTLAAESMPAADQETNDSANTEEAADGHPTGSGLDQGITKEAAAETAAGLPDDQGAVEEDAPDTGAAAVEEDQGTGNVGAWIACKDEEGREYFYNQETNETAWEIPEAELEQLQAMADKDTTEQEGKPVDAADGATETPEVASELPNPDASVSNESYLQEEIATPEVSPEGTAKSEGSVKGEAEESLGIEDRLPPGWVEMTDPSSGRQYFYNAESGETTWDSPHIEIDSQRSVEPPTLDTDNQNIPEQDLPSDWEKVNGPEETQPDGPEAPLEQEESTQDVDRDDGDPPEDNLPDGWTQVEDPQSHQVYYYNEGTGETTWEKPEPVTSAAAETTTQPDSALPKGWVEAQDPTTLKSYYHNTETAEVRWDRPAITEAAEREEWEVVEGVSEEKLVSAQKTNAKRLNRPGRPFHASAHMAFGGRLCRLVSGPSGKTSVEIKPLHKAIAADGFVNSARTKRKHGIFGPLHKTEDQEVIKAYIQEKERSERSDLLWRLIDIAGSSKGKLRSLVGATDPNSPESSIVSVLLEDAPVPRSGDDRKVDVGNEAASEPDIGAIEELLVKGEREEAVRMAVRERQYALALLVAGMCGRETYQYAAKEFCDNAIPHGSPLHTIAVMFSAPSQANDTRTLSSLFERDATDLKASWKSQLAAIINNRIAGWESAVGALGDRLREAGCFEAAHFCYMVCGTPLSSPVQRDSRWTLVGCNVTPADVILRTETSIEAFLRTEAYEWAKRRGNPRANIKTLQSFTALYSVRLAEYGFVEEAMNYAESALECFGESPGVVRTVTLSSKPLGLAVLSADKNSLVLTLNNLHERLEKHLGQSDKGTSETTSHDMMPAAEKIANETPFLPSAQPPASTHSTRWQPNVETSTAATTTPPRDESRMQPPGFSIQKPPTEDSTAAPAHVRPETENTKLDNPPSESVPAPPQNALPAENNVPNHRRGEPVPAPPQSLPVNLGGVHERKEKARTEQALPPMIPSKVSRKPPTEDSNRPAFLAATQSAPSTPAAKAPKALGKPSTAEPEKAPTSPSPGMQTPTPAMQTPTTKKNDAIAAAPASAPANLHKVGQAETPSSANNRGWFDFGIKDYFTKKLNPDATTADLGGQMEAYFDEKTGRWVFPGDDPNEVPAALGPPPKTPMAEKTQSAPEPEPAAPSDPLAAMMAPPPSRRPGPMRAPAGAKFSPAVPGPGGGKQGSSAPPQFAVFKPPS